MKKVIIIILGVLITIFIGMFIWYNLSLGSVSKKSDKVSFIIESGTSKINIIENLKEANLIKSELASLVYIKFNRDIIFKAGTYELDRNMSAKEIYDKLSIGSSSDNTMRLTFKEGVTLKKFIESIAKETNQDSKLLIEKINSKEYLEPLIEKYWFLEDTILSEGIYYPLEGYLYPNTYEIYNDSTIEIIIGKMLDEMAKQLESLRSKLETSDKSIHEIITMASIIEKEAISDTDRAKVSQVIYKRLNIGMSLGMDVTTYYGVQKDMKETLLPVDLDDENPYNTRVLSKKGLPIGPICNPSISSISAALNPSDTEYIYFFADVVTGNVYFTENYSEFLSFKKMYS